MALRAASAAWRYSALSQHRARVATLGEQARPRHRQVPLGAPQPARRGRRIDGRHAVLSAATVSHVLAIRDFALFLTGRFCNVLAAYMQWVAIGWYLYDLTRDPMTLGWAGLASFVPIALLTLPAGDLADRVDRRLLLFVAHLIQAVAAALLLVLVALHTTVTWPFYGALLISGSTRALAGPASKSLAPLLVPREQFAQSVAWSTSAQQTAIIAGPALGGLIYLLGAPITFAACFVMALLAAVAMLAIRTRVVASKEGGTMALERAMAGLRYLRTQPIVLGALSLDLFAVLLGGVNALLPVFSRDILHVGSAGLGMLRSMFAVGAITTSLVLAQLPEQRQPHAGRALFGGVAVFGIGAIVFALSGHFAVALVALGTMGAADAMRSEEHTSELQSRSDLVCRLLL